MHIKVICQFGFVFLKQSKACLHLWVPMWCWLLGSGTEASPVFWLLWFRNTDDWFEIAFYFRNENIRAKTVKTVWLQISLNYYKERKKDFFSPLFLLFPTTTPSSSFSSLTSTTVCLLWLMNPRAQGYLYVTHTDLSHVFMQRCTNSSRAHFLCSLSSSLYSKVFPISHCKLDRIHNISLVLLCTLKFLNHSQFQVC